MAVERGTALWKADEDVLRVYDGENWFLVTGLELAELGSPLLGQVLNGLLPEETLRDLLVWIDERDAEAERLALRQLLAESQAEVDDDDGPDGDDVSH
jgi:hypothetical protein